MSASGGSVTALASMLSLIHGREREASSRVAEHVKNALLNHA
jgi:hypothetical protein